MFRAITGAHAHDGGRLRRTGLILAVAALHFSCYYLAATINTGRPSAALYSVELGVDAWIPYIAWTWPVYYAADLYILLGLPMILWRLPFRAFVAAILTAAAVILGGAMLQVLVPARSPWPEQLTSVQAWYHRAVNVCPWTCFPSMHVALVVLGTGFAFSTTRSVLGRSALATLAIAIAASTLTLKEHYVMDVLVGTVLALIGYRLWFRGCSSHLRPLWSISH